MSQLNSYSLTPSQNLYPFGYTQKETHIRIFDQKGLFIIPYDLTRIIAKVTVTSTMLSTVNEYVNQWVNPNLGFYGYFTARNQKVPIGSPTQINQRQQILYTWSDSSVLLTMELWRLLQAGAFDIDAASFNPFAVLAPSLSDFTISLQRLERIELKVEIEYFDVAFYDTNNPQSPVQSPTNPSGIPDIPPPNDGALPPDPRPTSNPYRPGNGDFGESNPGNEPPDVGTAFRVQVTASYVDPNSGETVDINVGSNYVNETLVAGVTVSINPTSPTSVVAIVPLQSGTTFIVVVTSTIESVRQEVLSSAQVEVIPL